MSPANSSLLNCTAGLSQIAGTQSAGIDAVLYQQEVITNLGAAKLEFRTEDDPDVVPYTHGRNIEVGT